MQSAAAESSPDLTGFPPEAHELLRGAWPDVARQLLPGQLKPRRGNVGVKIGYAVRLVGGWRNFQIAAGGQLDRAFRAGARRLKRADLLQRHPVAAHLEAEASRALTTRVVRRM